jgi:4-hydroxy-L-threonine phosphate dehydrogenase PdxA
LIPIKTMSFHESVNVTLGLPYLRVSVDHGTAFDRAWKGIANPESMIEAIDVAVRMLAAKPASKPIPKPIL